MATIISRWQTRYNPKAERLYDLFTTADHEVNFAQGRIDTYEANMAYTGDPKLQAKPHVMENVRRSRESSCRRHEAKLENHLRALDGLSRMMRTLSDEASRACREGRSPEDSWRTSAGSKYENISGLQRLEKLENELDALIEKIKRVGIFLAG